MPEDALQPPEDYAALTAWALDKATALETTRQELLQAQTGLVGAKLLIEKLKIALARLKRETYGASSESLARIDQLELSARGPRRDGGCGGAGAGPTGGAQAGAPPLARPSPPATT